MILVVPNMCPNPQPSIVKYWNCPENFLRHQTLLSAEVNYYKNFFRILHFTPTNIEILKYLQFFQGEETKRTSEGFGGNVVSASTMSGEQPTLEASGGQSSLQDRSRWEEGIKVKVIVEILLDL